MLQLLKTHTLSHSTKVILNILLEWRGEREGSFMGCRKECYKVQIIIMKLAFFFQHTDTFDQHFFTILGEGPPLMDPPVP